MLSELFDYQKFEGNKKLAKMIEETELRYGTRLSMDDLDRVSAAGEKGPLGTNKPEIGYIPVK